MGPDARDEPRVDPVPYRVVGTFADTANTLDTTPGILYPSWAPESFDGDGWFDQLLVQAKPGQGEAAKAQMLAAARQAAGASTRYHYIRTLGGLARWTLMDPPAREDPPPWALRLRAWEGGFYGGWVTDDVVGPFKGGPGTWGW